MSDLLAGVPRREGALFGLLAYGGGAVLIVPIVLAAPGPIGDNFLQLPVAMATFSYALLHVWPLLFGFPGQFLTFGVVPASILTAAGYLLAKRTTDRSASAPVRGAAVLFGYLPATGVSLLYAGVRFQLYFAGDGEAAAIANVLDPIFLGVSVTYTGILFPLLFGGLGGKLAERRED